MNKIIGSVYPIPTVFKANGDLDLDSVINYTNFLLDAGVKNILVTVGTSRFNLLDFEEMFDMNKAVGEASEFVNKFQKLLVGSPLNLAGAFKESYSRKFCNRMKSGEAKRSE